MITEESDRNYVIFDDSLPFCDDLWWVPLDPCAQIRENTHFYRFSCEKVPTHIVHTSPYVLYRECPPGPPFPTGRTYNVFYKNTFFHFSFNILKMFRIPASNHSWNIHPENHNSADMLIFRPRTKNLSFCVRSFSSKRCARADFFIFFSFSHFCCFPMED